MIGPQTYHVKITGSSEGHAKVSTSFIEPDRFCIELQFNDLELYAEDYDYFDTFCKIRTQLEKYNLIPLCYASALNYYPSGMSRVMGQGLKTYKLDINKPCTEEPVDIFSYGADITPATVSIQKQFHEKWVQSISKRESILDKINKFIINR